jgi:predicted Zn-dependent protease
VIEPYLQGLAARLARAEKLPQGMAVHVHYDKAPVVNAMATLGGHVVIYQGLLEVVPHENALAMVLAHEIAHVRHRHPIASMGRAAAFSFALTTLGGDGGLVQSTIAQGGNLTLLSFSRSQEAEADATAFANLHAAYGHVAGADAFFRVMLSRAEAGEPLRFLASHPLNAQRIELLGALAAQRSCQAKGDITPLPAAVRAEIERRRQAATKLAP